MVIKWLWPEAVQLERGVWLAIDVRGHALRLGPWIVISSKLFYKLTMPEVMAVVAHERGHRWHGLIRGLVALFCPSVLPQVLRRQEFAADAHAVKLGYRQALISALRKLDASPEIALGNYPATSERLRRLEL